MGDHSYLADGAPTNQRARDSEQSAGEIRSGYPDVVKRWEADRSSAQSIQGLSELRARRETGERMRSDEAVGFRDSDVGGERVSSVVERRSKFSYSVVVSGPESRRVIEPAISGLLDAAFDYLIRDVRVSLVVEEVVREG